MLIDPFTVLAQVVNFLILAWALKRFLYGPILRAIDDREKRISAQLKEAESQKAEAQKEKEALQREREELEEKRSSLLSRAEAEAQAQRQRLLDLARRDAEAFRTRIMDSLREEQRNLGTEIIRRIEEEVIAVARKALADLASASLEQRMVEAFLERLSELSKEEKDRISSVPPGRSLPPAIRTAFPLSPEQWGSIERAVKDLLPGSAPVRFESAPDLIGGIELSLNGYRLAWTVSEYLATLRQRVEEASVVLASQSAQPAGSPDEPGT